MAPVVAIIHLSCTDHETQLKTIEPLKKIAEHSQTSEPDVTKYAVTVPREGEAGHGTDIVIIEQYTDEAARRKHLELPAVKEFLSGLESATPSPLAKAPEIYAFEASFNWTKPETKDVKNPVVISAHFGYQPGKSTPALEGWRALVDYCKKEEPGTLSYAVMDDVEASFIRTAELYENREVIASHLKGPMIAANQQQNGAWRSGKVFVFRCTLECGYFLK